MKIDTLLVVLCAALLTQEAYCDTSLTAMNEAECKACGIEKLTAEEKDALNAWIAKQIPAPVAPPQIKSHKIEHGEYTVAANVNLGRFISLENGLTYDIPSRSRKKTMSWKVGDKVRLVEPIRPVNYKLENLVQKQTIGAKIATVKTAPQKTKSE